jgi:hypothetical protein
MRPAFPDEGLRRAFSELGYVVVDALDRHQVTAMLDLQAATPGPVADGFRHSMQMGPGEGKARIRSALVDLYETCLASFLPGHQVMTGVFVEKGPSGQSTVPAHIDWSFADESRHRSVNAWVALSDTTPENGALAVVPRSHRLPLTVRGSGTPSPFRATPEAISEFLEVVPMRAGQAILYDGSLIHGSGSNASGKPRVAVGMSLLPVGAPPIHYVGDIRGEGRPIREFAVDAEFFHGYVVDPELGWDPNVEALTVGRPSREVAATSPITLADLKAVASGLGRNHLSRLRRELLFTRPRKRRRS